MSRYTRYKRWFIVPLFLAISSAGIAAFGNETQSPRIQQINGKWSVVLSDKMKSTLADKAPKFRIFEEKDFAKISQFIHKRTEKQLPYAVIGDFNGDGVDDIALFGDESGKACIKALLSNSPEYQLISINCDGPGSSTDLDSYISLGRKNIRSFDGAPIQTVGATIMEIMPTAAAVAYYYKDHSFESVTIGD